MTATASTPAMTVIGSRLELVAHHGSLIAGAYREDMVAP
jgi:hypothetical protein